MAAPDNFIILSAGKFDLQNGGGPQALDRLFASIKAADAPRVVIHFHGGLTSLKDGETAATTLNEDFSPGSSPIFPIWETSIQEVLGQNLPAIFNEAIFQRILRLVSQFVKAKIDKSVSPTAAARGLGGLPLSREDEIQGEINKAQVGGEMFTETPPNQVPPGTTLTPQESAQIQQQVQGDLQLQIQAQQIANSRQTANQATTARGIAVGGSTVTLMDPDVLTDIAPAVAGQRGLISMAALGMHIVTVVGRVINRFGNRRDHGAYLTIVEEILREFYIGNAGKFIWDAIKTEVDEAFAGTPDSGGTALVNQINAMWTSPQGAVKPKIILIGHSAGAIYVSRLLKELHAKLPPDFKMDIVFIAPACTFSVFKDAITNAPNRVDRLRIFGMSDPIERKDAIAGPIYPASLLYFVSGLLESEADEPILGMQRFYQPPYSDGAFPDIASVKGFGALTIDKAFAWADIAQGDGANCDMHSHGGWITDAPATHASVISLVKNGF